MPKLSPALLTIELVPENLWQANLHHLLSRKDWQLISRDTAADVAGRCEICNERPVKGVQCHEQWHYDDILHVQTLEKTVALCPKCHQVKHWGLSQKRGLGNIILVHLMTLNNWSEKQAFEYIDESFIIWHERNKYTWTQDLTWLSTHYPEMRIRK